MEHVVDSRKKTKNKRCLINNMIPSCSLSFMHFCEHTNKKGNNSFEMYTLNNNIQENIQKYIKNTSKNGKTPRT